MKRPLALSMVADTQSQTLDAADAEDAEETKALFLWRCFSSASAALSALEFPY